MTEGKIIDTYSLPPVDNVCDQILREVISLSKVSMAHVIMQKWNVSLLHHHEKMHEIYFILEGEGILYSDNKALQVSKWAYCIIPPKTPHTLENVGKKELEHLVFALPPFDAQDVVLSVEEKKRSQLPREKFSYTSPIITALDGASVRELMSEEERKELDFALAIGFLPANKKATPHYHISSEELYYVIDWYGTARVWEQTFNIQKGSLVYVPTNRVHALENNGLKEKLEVLCVSSPRYSKDDFLLAE